MNICKFCGDRVHESNSNMCNLCRHLKFGFEVISQPKKPTKGEKFITFCIVYFLVLTTVILVIVRSH